MKTIRWALSLLALLLLGGGYAASQLAWHQGRPHEYAQQVDRDPVVWLSLALLIAAIVLAFVPEREEEQP